MKSCPIIDAFCKTPSNSPIRGESSFSPDLLIPETPYAHRQCPLSSPDVGIKTLFHCSLFSQSDNSILNVYFRSKKLLSKGSTFSWTVDFSVYWHFKVFICFSTYMVVSVKAQVLKGIAKILSFAHPIILNLYAVIFSRETQKENFLKNLHFVLFHTLTVFSDNGSQAPKTHHKILLKPYNIFLWEYYNFWGMVHQNYNHSKSEQIMTELLLFDFSQKLAITIKFGLFDFTFFLEVTVFLYFSILLHISLIPKFDTLPNLTNFAALDHSRLKALKNSRMILNSGKYETVPYVRQVHFSSLVNGSPLWHLQKL